MFFCVRSATTIAHTQLVSHNSLPDCLIVLFHRPLYMHSKEDVMECYKIIMSDLQTNYLDLFLVSSSGVGNKSKVEWHFENITEIFKL